MLATIVAYAQNRVIGRDGRIPWKIPGEQLRFRELTLGNAVIMGRRTYEEIGRPLPGRLNIILSATRRYEGEDLLTAATLEEAMTLAGDRDIYIAGGAKLYEEALPLADRLYITEIGCAVEGDTFFPPFDETLYDREEGPSHGGSIPYTYVTYTRKAAGQKTPSEV